MLAISIIIFNWYYLIVKLFVYALNFYFSINVIYVFKKTLFLKSRINIELKRKSSVNEERFV